MSIQINIQMKLNEFLLDVDFSSEAGRIGILGASGSGKSLTLKSIAGVMKPDRGRVVLNGRTLFDSAGSHRINLPPQKRKIGYLFQNYALFPTMTVEENIACGLLNRSDYKEKNLGRKNSPERKKLISSLVHRLRLDGLEKRNPAELSGGQQQRVALARILIYEPDAILLDEPFSALDQFLREQLEEELMDMLADYKGVVILVSHSMEEIYRFSREVVVLDGGRCVSAGPTQEVFEHPDNKITARLTGCRNFSRAERIDSHTVRALDWGITFHLQRDVPENIHDLGYPSQAFVPVYGQRPENGLRFDLQKEVGLPAEHDFYLQPETETPTEEGMLIWRVPESSREMLKERGLPPYLQMQEDKIMLLN